MVSSKVRQPMLPLDVTTYSETTNATSRWYFLYLDNPCLLEGNLVDSNQLTMDKSANFIGRLIKRQTISRELCLILRINKTEI